MSTAGYFTDCECGWRTTLPTRLEAECALSGHFGEHAAEELPVSGRVRKIRRPAHPVLGTMLALAEMNLDLAVLPVACFGKWLSDRADNAVVRFL